MRRLALVGLLFFGASDLAAQPRHFLEGKTCVAPGGGMTWTIRVVSIDAGGVASGSLQGTATYTFAGKVSASTAMAKIVGNTFTIETPRSKFVLQVTPPVLRGTQEIKSANKTEASMLFECR